MLKDATTPQDALGILESAAEQANNYRQIFLGRDDVGVEFKRPIDLAYKGSARNGQIGKAHHTVHFNYAIKRERKANEDSNSGSGNQSQESESSKALKTRFAILFNLTMHQAISEVGCTKSIFAERLLNNKTSMARITDGLDLFRYPKSFGAVSPSRMRGGFIKYQKYLNSIIEDLFTELPHDNIVNAICDLKMPEMISPEEIMEWADYLGYTTKNNQRLWSKVSSDITKEEEESWLSYFSRKAAIIVDHPEKNNLIAHMFYSLRSASTEYVGVLFATLLATDELGKLEEKYGI